MGPGPHSGRGEQVNSPTFECLQAIAVNARARKSWEGFSDTIEFLRLCLSFAYFKAMHGAGCEPGEDSAVVLYGEHAALSHHFDDKPLNEVCAELAVSIESVFTGLIDAEDLLSAFLESQEALRRLQLRQAVGKARPHDSAHHA